MHPERRNAKRSLKPEVLPFYSIPQKRNQWYHELKSEALSFHSILQNNNIVNRSLKPFHSNYITNRSLKLRQLYYNQQHSISASTKTHSVSTSVGTPISNMSFAPSACTSSSRTQHQSISRLSFETIGWPGIQERFKTVAFAMSKTKQIRPRQWHGELIRNANTKHDWKLQFNLHLHT